MFWDHFGACFRAQNLGLRHSLGHVVDGQAHLGRDDWLALRRFHLLALPDHLLRQEVYRGVSADV